MKFKYQIYIFLILFLLPNCGYQPLYSSKGQNFSIGEVNIDGEKYLVSYFETQIKRLQNQNDDSYDLEIFLDSTKNTISKDKKGTPSIYNLSISAKIIYKQAGKDFKSKTFVQQTNYNNKDNKFDLKRLEKNIEKQLLNKIIEDFIFFTQSII